jgi:EAL domain-containing protein (putative c-di-GMP-specific phosphodiesterase class I)
MCNCLAPMIDLVAPAFPAPPAEPGRPSRVLVVDDDPTLRRMLTRLLKRAAFDVVDTDTGRGALAALAAQAFDVIVSDIHMPDGDGLDLLRSVRRIDLDIPVILMSGKPDVESAATALEFGAFRYLTKPLEAEAVEKLVRNAARAHALARIRREAMALASGGEAGAADRAGLEVRFDQALEKLWMAFQPIVEARSGALFGVEALMRSREPSIPNPPALLDAATQLKRLPVLGRRTRSLAGTAVTARLDVPSLFVNLHPADLLDADLIDESAPLTRIASRVILEVTEREALLTTPALIARLERLRELGFRIAVDDIGAGYSGLTSFTDLTPEIVKLDMALVRSIHLSTVKQRTVGALCTLCHEMGTLVVGEGVETPDERDCLLAIGCDLLQGYLIARPSNELPAAT